MKISKIVLVASSLFVLASCGSSIDSGADVTPSEAKLRVKTAAEKVSSKDYKFPTKFNFTVNSKMTQGEAKFEVKSKFSFDQDNNQFYYNVTSEGESLETWGYKDGDKYYSATRSGDSKLKTEVPELAYKDALSFALGSAKSSIAGIYTSMSDVVDQMADSDRAASLAVSTEGISALIVASRVLKSKGEGHLYLKYEFSGSAKIDSESGSVSGRYELAFDNYLPVLETINAVGGGFTTEASASFDWSKAAYPGNPNF